MRASAIFNSNTTAPFVRLAIQHVGRSSPVLADDNFAEDFAAISIAEYFEDGRLVFDDSGEGLNVRGECRIWIDGAVSGKTNSGASGYIIKGEKSELAREADRKSVV